MSSGTTSKIESGHSHAVQSKAKKRRLHWFFAFLLYPYGPFIYMTRLGVLKWYSAVVFLLTCVIVHVGMLSVLMKTNTQPWQPWLVMLLGIALYGLGVFQFAIGEMHGLWRKAGRRAWVICGWLFGLLFLSGLAAMIVQFHMMQHSLADK